MVISNPVVLQFYLPKEEKEAFYKNCFQADTTMSRELRRFIREFNADPPTLERLYYRDVHD